MNKSSGVFLHICGEEAMRVGGHDLEVAERLEKLWQEEQWFRAEADFFERLAQYDKLGSNDEYFFNTLLDIDIQAPDSQSKATFVKEYKDAAVESLEKIIQRMSDAEVEAGRKNLAKYVEEADKANNAVSRDFRQALLDVVDKELERRGLGEEQGGKEPKPVGKGVFGDIYDAFKGKAREAAAWLTKKRGGVAKAVFHNSELGDVDLPWGSREEKEGLDHIIDKHIERLGDFSSIDKAMAVIDDVIKNGDIVRGGKYKASIEKDGYRVIIKKVYHDNKGNIHESGNWVVTAFDTRKSEKEKGKSSQGTLTTPSSDQQRLADGVTLPSSDVSTGKGTEKSGDGKGKGKGKLKASTDTGKIDDFGEKIGGARKDVAGMRHPRVSVELDRDVPYTPKEFDRYNRDDKKSQNNTNKAVTISETASAEARAKIAGEMEAFERFAEFASNPKAVKNVIDIMVAEGIINQNDVAKLMDGGGLSGEGKDLVMNFVLGSVLEPESIRVLAQKGENFTMTDVREKVVMAAPVLLRNASLGDYSLAKELSDAIKLVYQARAGESGKSDQKLESFLRKPDMWDEKQRTPAEVYGLTVELLARLLDKRGTIDFRETMLKYNERAIDANAGQMDLFSGRAETKDEIATNLLKSTLKKYGETLFAAEPQAGDATGSNGAEPAQQEPAQPQSTVTAAVEAQHERNIADKAVADVRKRGQGKTAAELKAMLSDARKKLKVAEQSQNRDLAIGSQAEVDELGKLIKEAEKAEKEKKPVLKTIEEVRKKGVEALRSLKSGGKSKAANTRRRKALQEHRDVLLSEAWERMHERDEIREKYQHEVDELTETISKRLMNERGLDPNDDSVEATKLSEEIFEQAEREAWEQVVSKEDKEQLEKLWQEERWFRAEADFFERLAQYDKLGPNDEYFFNTLLDIDAQAPVSQSKATLVKEYKDAAVESLEKAIKRMSDAEVEAGKKRLTSFVKEAKDANNEVSREFRQALLDVVDKELERRGLGGEKKPVIDESELSDVTDEFGNRFVKASDEGIEFGEITEEMGLTAAPIRLSVGEDTVDENGAHHGYGMVHIDAEHGEQIRAAGFKSVRDFVEQVTKNFTMIRKGGERAGHDTYVLELVDKHSNVLYIELSRDGKYWTINTAGIFREKYTQKKEVVWSRPALKSGTATNASGVNHSHNEGGTVSSGNSPQTTSTGKGTEKSGDGKGKGKGKLKASTDTGKIDDFGEKIGGARKDVAGKRIEQNRQLSQKDVEATKNLDAIFPKRQIDKLVESGEMSQTTARSLYVMHGVFDALNRLVGKYTSHKARLGVVKLRYRDLLDQWDKARDKDITVEDIALDFTEALERDVAEIMERYKSPDKENAGGKRAADSLRRDAIRMEMVADNAIRDYMRTYEALDYPNVKRPLKAAVIVYHPDMSRPYWVKSNHRAGRGYPFATLEQAVERMKKLYPETEPGGKGEAKDNKKQRVGGLSVVETRTGFVVKSNKVHGDIYFSQTFGSRGAAEKWMTEHAEELEELERRYAENIEGKSVLMVQREGVDYRNGRNITPQEFLDTFGFRGVEFGNWVTNKERQPYLNETYDAIMDFCAIVGISPKAFSLGGRLGLAFGARGKSRAMAHYEPAANVINLTRKNGIGSLAHEWFHALDNYLAKSRTGNVLDMASRRMADRSPLRREVAEVLDELGSAYGKLGYSARSRKAGDYWGDIIEQHARAFGSYIYDKVAEKQGVSPMLSRETPELMKPGDGPADVVEQLNSRHPYPTAKERETINPIFDKLFKTIQEKVDDKGNAVLFHKAVDPVALDEGRRVLRDALHNRLKKIGWKIHGGGQELMDGINTVLARMQLVFHGSGADYNRVDHSYMGTGEGAQAYGWGTYGTEVRGIGVGYAERSARGRKTPAIKEAENKEWDAIAKCTDIKHRLETCRKRQEHEKGEMEKYGDELSRLEEERTKLVDVLEISKWEAANKNRFFATRTLYEGSKENFDDYSKRVLLYESRLEKAEKELSNVRQELDKLRNKGILYTFEIPDDNGKNYLHWDKPVGEEGIARIEEELIKRGFKKIVLTGGGRPYLIGSKGNKVVLVVDTSAKNTYAELAEALGSDKAASEFLHELGFTGIKYPADYLRGGRKDGALNFVIFSDKDIKIKDKVRLFMTDKGEAYGFETGGEIYFDDRIAGADTLLHEPGHIVLPRLRAKHPELWEQIKEQLGKDEFADIRKLVEERYKDLVPGSEDYWDEVLQHYFGREGERRLQADVDWLRSKGVGMQWAAKCAVWKRRVQSVLRNLYYAARDFFHIPKNITDPEDIIKRMEAEVLGKRAPKGRPDIPKYSNRQHDKKVISMNRATQGKTMRNGTVIHANDAAKIQQNLESKARDYENKPRNTSRKFLSAISDAFGERKGHNSEYFNIELPNGDIVTLRASNHNGDIGNFDKNGQDNVVSIIVSRFRNSGLKGVGKADVVEFYYNQKKLEALDGKPLAYILRDIAKLIDTGEYNNTIPADRVNSTYTDINGERRVRTETSRDYAFRRAVERGDTATVQRMLAEEAKAKGYNPESDYQGSIAFNGAAPSRNGYFETKEERKEAWDNGDFDGEQSLGDFVRGIDIADLDWRLNDSNARRLANETERESIGALQDAVNRAKRGKRNVKIKVYRAVPDDVKEGKMRNGDWVTPSRKYAEYHISLQEWSDRGRIIEQEVPIEDIWWDGNDINEWGYDDGKNYAYSNTKNNRKLFEVTYDDDGEIIPLSQRFNRKESNVRYSLVADKAKIDELERGEKIKTYRAMQLIDGKLYPPMAARVKGEYVEPWEIGKWQQADEHPELMDENGKFKLDKGKGEGSLKAAYNPYIHASRSPLNDQFTGAYARPQLVTVEMEVPASELSSGYKAQGAKDAVGEMSWHAGPVSSKLAKAGEPRKVILTRWGKVTRIVPDAEAADMISGMVKDKSIEIPANTVTPSMLKELEKRGVKIDYSRMPQRNNGDALQGYPDTPEKRRVVHRARIEETARRTAAELGGEVEFVERDQIPQAALDKFGQDTPGWYDNSTGKVHIVPENCGTETNVRSVVLHELAGHKNVNELIGTERMRSFFADVFNGVMSEGERRQFTKGDNWYKGAEWVAKRAEQGIKKPAVWNRLVGKFRWWLWRERGVMPTRKTVDYLLWKGTQEALGRNTGLRYQAENMVRDRERMAENPISGEMRKALADDPLQGYTADQHEEMLHARRLDRELDGLNRKRMEKEIAISELQAKMRHNMTDRAKWARESAGTADAGEKAALQSLIRGAKQDYDRWAVRQQRLMDERDTLQWQMDQVAERDEQADMNRMARQVSQNMELEATRKVA